MNELLTRIAGVLTEMRCLAEGTAQSFDSEPVKHSKSGSSAPRGHTSTHDHHLSALLHWIEEAERAVEREKRREPTEDKPEALTWRVLNEHIGRRVEHVAEREGVTVKTVTEIRHAAGLRARDGQPAERKQG